MSRRRANPIKDPILILFRSIKETRLFDKNAIEIVPSFLIKKKNWNADFLDYDFLLITSANAVSDRLKKYKINKTVAVGRATANRCRSVIKNSVTALKESSGQGIFNFFLKQKRKNRRPLKILYPRSSRADFTLIKNLRKLGYDMVAPVAYVTHLIPLRSKLKKFLVSKQSLIFLVTSPSSALAIKKSLKTNEFQSSRIKWISIGPTTKAYLRSQGIKADQSPKSDILSLIQMGRRLAKKISGKQ